MTRALVTGGGSGIGAAVARRLAADGLDIVVADLSGSSAMSVAGELGATGVQLDVRDEEQVRAVVTGVDVLVNSAGIGSTTNTPSTPLEVWEDVFAVNARGTFLCCKHAIPGMLARGGGSIVNVASVAALVGLRNRAAYSASKGAVVSLTRALGRRPRQRRDSRQRRVPRHRRLPVGATPGRGVGRVDRRLAASAADGTTRHTRRDRRRRGVSRLCTALHS